MRHSRVRVAVRLAAVFVAVCFSCGLLFAHPGSGIVVDRQGKVYFLDTAGGVWTIETGGKLRQLPSPRFHWMTLDADDVFRNVRLPSDGGDITRVAATPAVLVASDFPIVTGRNGDLYFPSRSASAGLRIMRFNRTGQTSVFAPVPAGAHGPLAYVNGLAIGPDDSVYYTEDDAIWRINPKGQASNVVKGVMPPGCIAIPGNDRPLLRGLAVDPSGIVYVAASGCGQVLRVASDGRISTILQTQAPWSPTAVALFGTDIYVQEYLHTEIEDRPAWIPRVRKITANGTSTIIATVTR